MKQFVDLEDAVLRRPQHWPMWRLCSALVGLSETAAGPSCTPPEFSSKRCREATGEEEEDHRGVKSAHL